jgi:glutamate racemase
MGDQRPIGIFDSGVGGLTVLKEIREQLPLEPTIYVADLLHFPYGPRYQDIACNTATAAALNQARELFELPIIGVISPGAQAAVEATKNNRIGVISTEGTMRSQEYLHAIKEIDPMVGVYQKACPELVEIVENGESDSPRAERVLRDNLADIVRLGADTLVLGCTHYPLLKPAINRVYPGSFALIDSATTTASKVERHLEHSRLRATDGSPRHEVLVTGVPQRFDEIAANLFGEAIDAEEVQVWEPQKM